MKLITNKPWKTKNGWEPHGVVETRMSDSTFKITEVEINESYPTEEEAKEALAQRCKEGGTKL